MSIFTADKKAQVWTGSWLCNKMGRAYALLLILYLSFLSLKSCLSIYKITVTNSKKPTIAQLVERGTVDP